MKKQAFVELLEEIGERFGILLVGGVDAERRELTSFREDLIHALDGEASREINMASDLDLIARDLGVEPTTHAIRGAINQLGRAAVEKARHPAHSIEPTFPLTRLARQPVDREVRAGEGAMNDPATGEDLSAYSMYPSTPPPVETARKERFELDKQLTLYKNIVGRVAGELGVGQWDAEGTELVARATLARNAAALIASIKKDIKALNEGIGAVQNPRENEFLAGQAKALHHIHGVLMARFSKPGLLAWVDTTERVMLVEHIAGLLRVNMDNARVRPDIITYTAYVDAFKSILMFMKAPIPTLDNAQ